MCSKRIVNTDYFNVSIFHFMRLEHFEQMLNSGEMKIAKICSWEDNWEAFFLKKRYDVDRIYVETGDVLSSVYGQSWTMTDPNIYDVLWRCYNNELNGYNYVAIKSSVLKLANTVNNNFNETQKSAIYLAPIIYKTQEQIDSELDSASLDSSSQIQEDIVAACFSKRVTFEYENELRLIFFDDTPHDNNPTLFSESIEDSSFLKVPISNDFIEEIIIDPRLEAEKNSGYKQQLLCSLSKMGMHDDKIQISKCYDFQNK